MNRSTNKQKKKGGNASEKMSVKIYSLPLEPGSPLSIQLHHHHHCTNHRSSPVDSSSPPHTANHSGEKVRQEASLLGQWVVGYAGRWGRASQGDSAIGTMTTEPRATQKTVSGLAISGETQWFPCHLWCHSSYLCPQGHKWELPMSNPTSQSKTQSQWSNKMQAIHSRD